MKTVDFYLDCIMNGLLLILYTCEITGFVEQGWVYDFGWRGLLEKMFIFTNFIFWLFLWLNLSTAYKASKIHFEFFVTIGSLGWNGKRTCSIIYHEQLKCLLIYWHIVYSLAPKVGLGLIKSKNLWLGVQFNWLFLGYF